MSASKKIFNAIYTIIKFAALLHELRTEVKKLQYDVQSLDRRLIRLETFFEITMRQKVLVNPEVIQ